jgi:hypothetical protein
MIQKIKEYLIGIVIIGIVIIVPIILINNYRHVDNNYACTGYSGSMPKVYSFNYKRHYNGMPWTDRGYLAITLESNWYDFAAFYYFDNEGELDKKIMDTAVQVMGVGLTTIKDSLHAYALKKKLTFNLKTKVISLEGDKGVIFEGICKEVK